MRFFQILAFLVLAGFTLSNTVYAQPRYDLKTLPGEPRFNQKSLAELEKEIRELSLPENIAFGNAVLGVENCRSQPGRARKHFEEAIRNLVLAQEETRKLNWTEGPFKGIYTGENPRTRILHLISRCDPTFALQAHKVSRPEVLSASLASFCKGGRDEFHSQAKNEHNLRLELIRRLAFRNPEAAFLAYTEAISCRESASNFSKIRLFSSPDTTDLVAKMLAALAEDLTAKGFSKDLDIFRFQIQLLNAVIRLRKGRYGEEARTFISDSLYRDLVRECASTLEHTRLSIGYLDIITRHTLASDFPELQVFKVPERASVKRAPARPAQEKSFEQKEFEVLISQNLPPAEMLERGEKLPEELRRRIVDRAAAKFAETDDWKSVRSALESIRSGGSVSARFESLVQNKLRENVTARRFKEASSQVERLTDMRNRVHSMLLIAEKAFAYDPAANLDLALALVEKAEKETANEQNPHIRRQMMPALINAYARIEPESAFRILESWVPFINESSDVSIRYHQLSYPSASRSGEFHVFVDGIRHTTSTSYRGITGSLVLLWKKDPDRTHRFLRSIKRNDVRLSMKLGLMSESYP
ncbi:MAG TPA: hypothetical protein VMM38_10335 [Aridibacter sp.]|nr:hypothetical protein [Aridibacter sp.]